TDLVETYERFHVPILPTRGVEALRSVVEENTLSQADLMPLLGTSSIVSEVPSREARPDPRVHPAPRAPRWRACRRVGVNRPRLRQLRPAKARSDTRLETSPSPPLLAQIAFARYTNE